MAFTLAEKVRIRFYLGWSDRFHQFDSRLEQAMSAVEANPDTETFIRDAIMVDIEDIRTKLKDAHGRLKAMKVGSINLPGQNELMLLRMEGRRHVGSLAATFGVEVRHDIFGSSRYKYFAGHGGLFDGTATGLGGYINHG